MNSYILRFGIRSETKETKEEPPVKKESQECLELSRAASVSRKRVQAPG